MNKLELAELRKLWVDAVILFERPTGSVALKPCWFADHRLALEELEVDVGGCEGVIQGAHWLKRQRVEKLIALYLRGAREEWQSPLGWRSVQFDERDVDDLIQLAAWDARNGVAGCERHHQRFDSQRMPPLVVPRIVVPQHVVEFSEHWGFETALEQRNPRLRRLT